MKLSDLDGKDIQLMASPEDTAHAMKLSEMAPDDVQEAPKYSEAESALRGAGQGASFGFGDELVGGAKALANAPGNKKSLKDLYTEYRDIERNKNKIAEAQNPKSYLAGNLAGGVASGLATGGLGEGVAGAAGLGALTGLGASSADLTKGEVGKAALDTGVGGVLGAGAGALAKGVGSALAPEALEQRAGAAAVRGLGGKVTPANIGVGNTVLDNGLLPIMGGAEKTAQGITGKIGDIEQNQVQPLLQGVSQNAAFPGVSAAQGPISKDVNALAISFNQGLERDDASAIAQKVNKSAFYWGNKLDAAANDPSKLNELRKAIDVQAQEAGSFNAPADLKPMADYYQQLRDLVNSRLRGTAEQVSENAGKDLKTAMGTQSDLIQAQKMSQNAAAGDLNNPTGLTPKTLASGAGGAALTALGHTTMGPLALAGAAGKVAAESATGQPIGRLANIVSARTQDWAGKQLATPGGQAVMKGALNISPKGIASSGVQTGIQNVYTAKPAQLKQAADALTSDDSTKDLGNALNDAITNGDEDAKNKVLFAAEQIPSVRAKFREALGRNPEVKDSSTGDNVDNFLDSVAKNESDNGRDFNHQTITSGPQAGQTAIGTFGLLPNTVKEVLGRSNDPDLDSLRGMSDDELKSNLEQNPTLERKVARELASRVIDKQGGDVSKAAFAWRHGHNMSPDRISGSDYQNDPYVQKFNEQFASK